MFNFNPFCTFQDMAQTGIHYEKNWITMCSFQDNIHLLDDISIYVRVYEPVS